MQGTVTVNYAPFSDSRIINDGKNNIRRLRMHTFAQIIPSVILPVVLYGCEASSLTPR
jgi:hypothetical protein